MMYRSIILIAVIGLVHRAAAGEIDSAYPRESDGYEVAGPTYQAGCDLGPLSGSVHILGADGGGVVVCSNQHPHVHSAHGSKQTAQPPVAPRPRQVQAPLLRADAALASYPTSAPTPSYPPIAKERIAPVPPAWMNWTGFYVGAHVGGIAGTTNFADPFGLSIFGGKITTPGFLAGGQIGFNWQVPNSNWVLGVEADASWLTSDGTGTCFAASVSAVNATCQVRPQASGTFTGRLGYAVGPSGRTLIYGKGGLGWANDQIDVARNNALAGLFGPAITSNSTSATFWGWTVGIGAERTLTPAWSLNVEYDYLALGSRNAANLGSSTFSPLGIPLADAPPGTSTVSQGIQIVKMAVNYKLGADPRGSWDAAPGVYPVKARPMQSWLWGWEIEGGVRYVGSWGQFQKNLGNLTGSALPSISSVSRLTYADMQTNAGELFGRIDTPWKLFIKGYFGGGSSGSGHMNDEDFGIPLLGTYAAYSNTLSSVATGNISYGVIDSGFNFLHGPGYKVGAFGGYFVLNQYMKAFGCRPIANINCIPELPTSGSPNITENDSWRAARIGLTGETMLTDWVKISGEVAYLPWVNFRGIDQHFFGNSGILASDNPESGRGQGVQLDALISYYLTPQWSIGVGGRYWSLWTTTGQANRDINRGVPIPPTAPQFFRAQVEQVGMFVQANYSFGPEWFCFISQSCR